MGEHNKDLLTIFLLPLKKNVCKWNDASILFLLFCFCFSFPGGQVDGIRDVPAEVLCDSAHIPAILSQSVKEVNDYESFNENEEELDSLFQHASASLNYSDFTADNGPSSKKPRFAETNATADN